MNLGRRLDYALFPSSVFAIGWGFQPAISAFVKPGNHEYNQKISPGSDCRRGDCGGYGGQIQTRDIKTLQFDYSQLRQRGVTVIHDWVTAIDPVAHKITLKQGKPLSYDRAIVAPGIDFKWNQIEGYDEAASEIMPHAWEAGPQTLLLQKQLEQMPNGGVVIIAPPANPFRCPPGPYERASQIAYYLKTQKPNSKIIILDAKNEFAKQGLFQQGWETHYKGIIEWVKGSEGGAIERVDVKQREVQSSFQNYKADVINIIPPQQAGNIAIKADLADSTGWCPIDPLSFESTRHRDIHVLGDAALANPLPKSAYAANSTAKTCAYAIVELLDGTTPTEPVWVNTCYSLIAPNDGISIAMIYRLHEGKITPVKEAGGTTPLDVPAAIRAQEASYAYNWFDNITHDIFF